jgi:hypothetical protein
MPLAKGGKNYNVNTNVISNQKKRKNVSIGRAWPPLPDKVNMYFSAYHPVICLRDFK